MEPPASAFAAGGFCGRGTKVTPYEVEPVNSFYWINFCYRLRDSIYFGGPEALGTIDLKTGELRICEEEYAAAKAYAEEVFDSTLYTIAFFDAVCEQDGVTIYSAAVVEANDLPDRGMVFVACEGGKMVGYMSVDFASDSIAEGIEIRVAGGGVSENAPENVPFPENAETIEREILSVSFHDTSPAKDVASLRISNPKGGFDELWIQEDTVIRGEDGERLEFTDLKEGQAIRATVCSGVLYDALVTETGTVEVDIYFRCYEIILSE